MKSKTIGMLLYLYTTLFVHSFVQLNPMLRTTKLSPGRFCSTQHEVAIIGSGAFSLALAKALSHKNIHTKMLVRNESVADHINRLRSHPKYLPEFTLPNVITATHEPAVAFSNINYIIHCIPMQISRNYLHSIRHLVPPQIPIISATKGIEQGTHCLMSEILEDTIGNERRFAYLSGPSFAQEIMMGQATAVMIASKNIDLANDVANVFSSPQFRVIPTNDVKVHSYFFLCLLFKAS
jgi:glycerol-3-phosphate dehydrogenase